MTDIKGKKAKQPTMISFNENSLLLYLEEIKRIPLLGREDEMDIAREAAKGNEKARNRLINANLRFVVKVAKQYRGMGMTMEDLIGEGNIGLLYAIDRYDVDRGNHFISYAVWWIRHFIRKAIATKPRMIRLPQNKIEVLMRIENAKRSIENSHGEKDELEEIAKILKMTTHEVGELLKLSQDPILLGSLASDKDNAITMEDRIEDLTSIKPEDFAEGKILRQEIDTVLDSLGKKEANILRARFGLGENGPMSLEEIGRSYKISKEAVRQIETRAIKHLQDSAQLHRLEAYVA